MTYSDWCLTSNEIARVLGLGIICSYPSAAVGHLIAKQEKETEKISRRFRDFVKSNTSTLSGFLCLSPIEGRQSVSQAMDHLCGNLQPVNKNSLQLFPFVDSPEAL